jgi:hypothetical protein
VESASLRTADDERPKSDKPAAFSLERVAIHPRDNKKKELIGDPRAGLTCSSSVILSD